MLTPGEESILKLLDEDDYGLWEIGWAASAPEPYSPADALEQAIRAVVRPQDRKSVEVVLLGPVGDESVRAGRPELDVDLHDAATWEVSQAGQKRLFLTVTPASDSAARAVAEGRAWNPDDRNGEGP